MTAEEIQQLAERIASGMAGEEEIRLYNRLCNTLQPPSAHWDEALMGDKAATEAAMKKNILRQTQAGKPFIPIRRLVTAAAAVLIIALGTASYFLLTTPKAPPPVVASLPQPPRFKNEVPPGQNGAILTLANGRQIVLDSAGNGALARQGNAAIIKKDGRIVYNHQGETAETIYNTMTTPRGRQYNLTLADGSKVWLNAASSITYPVSFSGTERRVRINGEAYFEIAHNTRMPFIVEKGDMSVQVLGTHFNINAYDDERSANVTLLEGSVKVIRGNNSHIISPGQQVQVDNDGGIRLLSGVDLDGVVAWKNGYFDFKGARIEPLMRQIARWYNVDVVYSSKIDDLFHGEIPRNTNLTDVLKILELAGKVEFEIDGSKIAVKPKG